VKTKPALEDPKLPITLRPDWFVWIFFVGLTLLCWAPVLAENRPAGIHWDHVALCLGITTSMIILLYTWNIVIGLEGITYKRLLVVSSSVSYAAMKSAQITITLPFGRSLKNRYKPVYGLLITSENSSVAKPLLINIKPFSRSGLALLMHAISTYAPQTQLDKTCERMKHRKMPSFLAPDN